MIDLDSDNNSLKSKEMILSYTDEEDEEDEDVCELN